MIKSLPPKCLQQTYMYNDNQLLSVYLWFNVAMDKDLLKDLQLMLSLVVLNLSMWSSGSVDIIMYNYTRTVAFWLHDIHVKVQSSIAFYRKMTFRHVYEKHCGSNCTYIALTYFTKLRFSVTFLIIQHYFWCDKLLHICGQFHGTTLGLIPINLIALSTTKNTTWDICLNFSN